MSYRIKIEETKSGDKRYRIQYRWLFFWADISVYSESLKNYAFERLEELRNSEIINTTYIK